MVTQWNSPAGARLTHPGLARERRVRFGELEALEQATVISIRRTGQNRGLIDITDSGLAYAAQLRQARKTPTARRCPTWIGRRRCARFCGPSTKPASPPRPSASGRPRSTRCSGGLRMTRRPIGCCMSWSATTTSRRPHRLLARRGARRTLGSPRRGWQVVAAWPGAASDDVVLRLLDVLNAEIERTDDPDRKSKLEKLRDGVAGIGRDVLTDVLSKVLTGQA